MGGGATRIAPDASAGIAAGLARAAANRAIEAMKAPNHR